ncbi:MerR family transcriptional regulator [Thiorhodococcus mannitoliphagus]|uniref:MerR family transcriptional regulator n=1 Tax=Thiorhodococcus mannitoliphagus TaxID=329406 RepID=A0A6P1DNP4_9GAMM|nr:MerR family transcriptional regulator [Thiorhodococcus mannitoliphagus]NEX19559.1 MerR family transcriptional regulator [Thiorhodococcus mannitoliphagus]
MTDRDPPESGQTFRIGTVSRLTGVPTDTLRVWERRYHVVTPVRSEAGTRHYAAEDVARLSLIKRLVDGGDAISSVANLSLLDLRERMRGAQLPERFSITERPCSVLVCGAYLADRLRGESSREQGIEFLGFFSSPDALLAAPHQEPPDVLVLELPTLHAESVREVNRLLQRSGAARALLVYGFATCSALRLLDGNRVIARRAPVDVDALCQDCIALAPGLRRPAGGGEATVLEGLGEPAPRKFSDAELARLAAVSPAGDCNWSRHLVDLVASLSAFETYGSECVDQSSEDPALITFIGACTVRARALMEAALERAASPEEPGSAEPLNPGDA